MYAKNNEPRYCDEVKEDLLKVGFQLRDIQILNFCFKFEFCVERNFEFLHQFLHILQMLAFLQNCLTFLIKF